MKTSDGMSRGVMVAVLLGLWISPTVLTGKIIYVDPEAPGGSHGTTWSGAYLCLQNALESAEAGDEIRVAQGVYKPDRRVVLPRTVVSQNIQASGNIDDSFVLPDGVTVKGGYAGWRGANPDARDVKAFPSILSGDLAGDDGDLPNLEWQTLYGFVMDPVRRGNSRTVVTVTRASSQTVLDGFTITAGHCEGGSSTTRARTVLFASVPSPSANAGAAGAFVDSGNPSFVRCTFYRNTVMSYAGRSTGGAALGTQRTDATFTECTFEQNIAFGHAGSSFGGAVLNSYGAPQFIDCTFTDNVTAGFDGNYAGGAVANSRSNCVLTDCSFVGNRAIDSMGGAVYTVNSGNPAIVDCTFEGNWANQGGAVYVADGCDPNVIGCTFLANEAANNGQGGAVFIGDQCTGNFVDCRFLGNLAGQGGAMGVRGYPTIVNGLFSGNAAARGAAIYLETGTFVDAINSTFSANAAGENGGTLYGLMGTTQFSNCILWGNQPQEIHAPSGLVQVHHSNVQGSGGIDQGNIDENPRFQDPLGVDGIAGTIDDDLRLSLGSPCLDAGDDAAVGAFATTDLDGLERVVGGRVDMGAYEFSGPLRYYVDAATGDDNNGGWGPREAFATIQRGIRAASEGYTVVVMPGVYTEEINFAGKAITVSGDYGGAILEAPGGYAVSFYTAERSTSVLKNIVIRNSNVGIFIAGASPTIRNVTVAGNEFGVAAYAGGNPDISNCILWDNIDGDLFGCTATYSCVRQGAEGTGNIRQDPLFADPENGDYHLLSEKGRFVQAYGLWSFDAKTSPCIDAGIPWLAPGAERMPNGGRINMGAFGGTPQASMSEWPLAGDLNRDGRVDFADLTVVLDQWLDELPMVSEAATGPNPLQPNPPRWDIDGEPHEVHGGAGTLDYYVEMKAAEVASPHSPVEYFFDCLTTSEVAPLGLDSGWQTSRSYRVLVGGSNQELSFRVRACDQANHMTNWSDWVMAIAVR
ncbi:MAG: choice-of-anchor Q domain-containing protein [Planctomycetota bacterium]|nr:choice-of-anchor Q domain-containing protein [Planctomycetota bacterium]